MKKRILGFGMLCVLLLSQMPQVSVAAAGGVVINEVAWAGSAASSGAEWIELYNASDTAVDLTGWKLFDDGAETADLSGKSIVARGYFLIEDAESAVPSVTADLISGLSLANTGDKLELKNAAGAVVDVVNASGRAWYAGSASGFLTMERIDAQIGDTADNFASSVGTPKAMNAVSSVPVNAPSVRVLTSQDSFSPGEELIVTVEATNLEEVFSYGVNLVYDADVLEFVSAEKGDFLDENDSVDSTFQAALLDGRAGFLSVAQARLEGLSAVSGDGELFAVRFRVVGSLGESAVISIAANSFVSAIDEDLTVLFAGTTVKVASSVLVPVSALLAAVGAERYQIKLTWQGEAEKYLIYRKNALGELVNIGESTETFFVDKDGVSQAGNIVPQVQYEYSVVGAQGEKRSEARSVAGFDNRGIKGDNDRTDLVDGRDLQRLALHFGQEQGAQGFDALVDTTYDGRIDGSDLIDLGAAFAKKYTP